MTENYGQQPLIVVSDITTMNATDDSTKLKPNEAILLQNVTKELGSLDVREGRAMLHSFNDALPAPCFGLSTFDPLDSDTMQYVAVSNALLYAGSTFPLTNTTLALTASTLMQLRPFKGKMLINDPVKGLAWYDGSTTGWAGVASPKVSKLIDDFESITGWSATNGTCTIDDTYVIHGRHALKFQASSGVTYSPRKTITTTNLTTFPSLPEGDGTVSTINDYIRLSLVRSAKADFTSCALILQTSSGNYYTFTISDLAEWDNDERSGMTFDLFMRKGGFSPTTTTALNWNSISTIGFNIVAATGKTPYIIADWLRLEKTGPIAKEFCAKIADFESDETWIQAAATVSYDYKYKTLGGRSIKLDGSSASAYRDYSPVLNLTSFDTGELADTIDAIELKVARDSSKTAGTLTLNFRDTQGAPVTAYSAISVASLLTPKITGSLKLVDPALAFQTILIRKDSFTNNATVTWNSLDRVTLTSSANGGAYYIDEIKLVKVKDKKIISNLEPSEGLPTITNAAKSGWNDVVAGAKHDLYRSDEGSSTSLYVKISSASACTIDITTTVDLTQYASGAASQDSDKIGPWIWISNSKNIEEISLTYDVSGGTFTNYYAKQLLRGQGQIPDLKKEWLKARFEKREHELQGAGTWAGVNKVRLTIATNSNGGAEIYLDRWIMERGEELGGTFYYRVTYRNPRGARSDFSNISNRVEVKSANILLSTIPTSATNSGYAREIWRIGGLSTEWRLVGILNDDTTTTFEDNVLEEDLGVTLPSVEYIRPYIAKAFTTYNNMVILANLTDFTGYRYKSMVMVSKPESFDEFDPLKTFNISVDDGYEIKAIFPFQDRIFVVKELGIYSFDPNNLDHPSIRHSGEFGVMNAFSYVIGYNDAYFLSPNKSLYLFNGNTIDPFGHEVQYYLDLIPDAQIAKIVAIYYNDHFLLSIPQTGNTYNTLVLSYYTPTKTWSVFTNWETSTFHVQNYSGASKLIGGSGANNYLFQYFSGDSDVTNAGVAQSIVGILQSANHSLDPTVNICPATIYLNARNLVADAPSRITIEPYLDTVDTLLNFNATIPSTEHKQFIFSTPDNFYFSVYVGFKMTIKDRASIRTFAYSQRRESRK